MKQSEQTVVLDLKLVEATRIRDEFGRIGAIAAIMDSIVGVALRKDTQAKVKAPDDALIPIRVQVTLSQAREILRRFQPHIGYPSYRDVYVLVKNGIEAAD